MNHSLKLALMPDGTPEIFKSIQGEGPKIGRISTFVRTSECNLTCTWCDTPYTWRWSEQLAHEEPEVYERSVWQRDISVNEIADTIRQLNCPHVIFTGGEPFLQQKRIVTLIDALSSFARSIEFETNGTIAPTNEIIARTTLFVVSPKLANSGVTRQKALKNAIHEFVNSGKAVFKLVADKAEDITEIQHFQKQFAIRNSDIWVMPCGRTPQQLHKTGALLADHVIEAGFQFTPRMHVDLFGDAQGT